MEPSAYGLLYDKYVFSLSRRDHQKETAYAGVELSSYAFGPFSVEPYERIGQPAMKVLHQVGDEAAGQGGVTRASFLAGTLREPSVGLHAHGNIIWPWRFLYLFNIRMKPVVAQPGCLS
jgi:hypothetical protein